MVGAFRLFWHDRKETKHRIATLEKIAEHAVTYRDLQACRDDVRAEDNKNLEIMYTKIEELSRQNAEQHTEMINQVLRLHSDR